MSELMNKLAGRFVVFEGADGCGKSTQLKRLADECRAAGVPVCEVRDPGGTAIGEKVRAILLDRDNSGMALRCEMLLYMASRAQLVHEKIAPALAKGHAVLSDRFVASTFAYQGAAGGLAAADIDACYAAACGPTRPTLTVIFDVDEQTAARRAGIITGPPKGAKSAAASSLFADRMEDRDAAFRKAVRQGYRDFAAHHPKDTAVINAAGDPDQVWRRTLALLAERLGA